MTLSLPPLVRPLIDVVFPSVCIACDRLRRPDEPFLCTACYRSLPRTNESDSLYRSTAGKLCEGGLIDRLISPFYFEQGSALQALVHELKYGGTSGIGLMLGREIARSIAGEDSQITIQVAIPVPLHRVKQRERGYNQSALLCRGIKEVTGISFLEGLLIRSRYTATQTALDPAERAANVQDAFVLRRKAAPVLRGANVILVDDVVTTGATLRACATVLRTAGVHDLLAATIAIAP